MNVQQGTESALFELKGQLRAVIRSALNANVTSQSCVSGTTITGNRYQTVNLGDEKIEGFRGDREDLLAGLYIDGKTACDLGSNLGETARILSRRGAIQVDAYEYDAYFTSIARLISAHEDILNVFHIAADTSIKGCLRQEYDVCLALAVYAYIEKIIDYVCSHVRELMIVETHEVDKNWSKRYIGKISPHFPYWGCFGVIKHGDIKNTSKRRLRLIFSKKPLDSFYVLRNRELRLSDTNSETIDYEQSKFPVFNQCGRIFEGDVNERLSTARIASLRDRLCDYDSRFKRDEKIQLAVVGEAYWLAFFLGLIEFNENEFVDSNNSYSIWWRRSLESGKGDPGLVCYLQDAGLYEERLRKRLTDFAPMLRTRAPIEGVEPIIAYCATPDHPSLTDPSLKKIKRKDTGEVVCVPTLDGHHRVFMHLLLGLRHGRAAFFWDPTFLRSHPTRALGSNYRERMLQYLGGQHVDDPAFD